MKFNFKKISAVAISTLLTGMTMGVAAAASYPAPFVSGGVAANTAVVYGTGQGVSDLDRTYGGNIQTDLQGYITSTGTSSSTTVEGGESFTLEKSSNSFNFNNGLADIYSNIGADEMDFLADGTYDDGDIDEDYEQTVTFGSKTLSLFADTDYENDEPTVGFKFDNGDTILSYEIEFDDVLNYTEMVDTDMPIMGKDYYVLAASSSQIDVLDSAEKITISEGETIEFKGKQVTIDYIDTDDVKLNVDGVSLSKLGEHEYEELSDGSYIVVNENLYASKEVGISKATISIGAGKMELINSDEAQLNDEDVDGLEVTITDNSGLSKLTLTWKSDRESFLTEDNAITMPGFEDLSLSFGGLEYVDDSETISFDNGETFTISMDNYEIPVFWYDGINPALGEEDNTLVINTSNVTVAVWTNATTYPDLTVISGQDYSNNIGLALQEDNRFIVTRVDNDLSDVETMYYQVNTIENDGEIFVELEDLIGDNDITFDDTESDDVGDITVQLLAVQGNSSGRAYINFSAASGDITYNKLVSDKGLVITIPTDAVTTLNATSQAVLTLTEADKDEDLGEGKAFTVTVKNNTNDKLHVSTHNLTSYDEEQSDDNYIGIVPSDLASKFTFDTSADEYDFNVEYFGKETTAEVNVVYGGSVETAEGTSAGIVMITDTEAATAGLTKNLIIVGGSCINSAAAKVLGGAYCGAAFTANTGVGSGQFLIKSSNAYASGKIALVVAGYESADTVNAVNYLINKKPDTSKNYKGTSATVAEEIVTTA